MTMRQYVPQHHCPTVHQTLPRYEKSAKRPKNARKQARFALAVVKLWNRRLSRSCASLIWSEGPLAKSRAKLKRQQQRHKSEFDAQK